MKMMMIIMIVIIIITCMIKLRVYRIIFCYGERFSPRCGVHPSIPFTWDKSSKRVTKDVASLDVRDAEGKKILISGLTPGVIILLPLNRYILNIVGQGCMCCGL